LNMSEIRDMVAIVAKEKGADLALNKSLKDFVIYSADYFDVTKEVLNRLNATGSR
jgi:Skp family chaperone for outer membrane proteins